MIDAGLFIRELKRCGIDFYAGVPDSLLRPFCDWLGANVPASSHVIAANEGAAVALAAGHFLATGRPGCVYMQNSGEGNAVNPLVSLTDADVYGIPLLLVIGWRGRPGVHDEPQHVKQGKITLQLLDVLGIPYSVLSDDWAEASAQIDEACRVLSSNRVYALVVRKNVFNSVAVIPSTSSVILSEAEESLSREEAIRIIADATGPSDVIVSSTGMISRELYEFREAAGTGHGRDFLTVGSMGHASQIALGISLEQPWRRVWCFDGDGAVLMHLGSLAVAGTRAGAGFVHVVFNNGAHDSVGGQPTAALQIDLPGVAKALGYQRVISVSSKTALLSALSVIPSAPSVIPSEAEEAPTLWKISRIPAVPPKFPSIWKGECASMRLG